MRKDAGIGVRAAGLPESGSGFAVIPIHTEVSRRAAGKEGFSAGRVFSKDGCYHSESVNVL